MCVCVRACVSRQEHKLVSVTQAKGRSCTATHGGNLLKLSRKINGLRERVPAVFGSTVSRQSDVFAFLCVCLTVFVCVCLCMITC